MTSSQVPSSAITVASESPLQSDVSSLLASSDAIAAELYPGLYRQPITAASLDRPDVTLLMARLDSRAAGLCLLIQRQDETAELKRMIVDPSLAGQGVGRALVNAAIRTAQELRASAILLEVGVRNAAAYRLYLSAGFVPTEVFPPYRPSEVARFLRLDL